MGATLSQRLCRVARRGVEGGVGRKRREEVTCLNVCVYLCGWVLERGGR